VKIGPHQVKLSSLSKRLKKTRCPALLSAATPHHTIRIHRDSMRGGGRLGTATVSTPDTILNAAGGGRGVT
jgi:hypothetical protein